MRPLALLLAVLAPSAFAQDAQLERAIRETGDQAMMLQERRAFADAVRDAAGVESEAAFPGAPAGQPSWHYLTKPLVGAKAARSRLSDGWRLDSLGETKDSAGFFSLRLARPKVDRRKGYTMRFRLAVRSERHARAERAGISVIVISDDLKGVELGFWSGEVWAQTDNPLFTHGEGAPFQTSGSAEYALTLRGDRYELTAGGRRVLEGPLKNYSSFGFPYNQPSFLFYGDDTSSAGASFELRGLRVE
jgi:hypothetical protein